MIKLRNIQLPLLSTLLIFSIKCATVQSPATIPSKADTVQKPIVVNFLHWNDFHSANIPYKSNWGRTKGMDIGGYATLAGYIDSLKTIYPGALVLNAGDDFQGSPISALTKGMSQILILNQIKPSAFTIGNHEFDYGIENLKKSIQAADFDIISCNLYDSTKMSLLVKPYKIIKSNGARIGVIGLILEDLKSTVLPDNMKGLATLNPAESIMKYVEEIQDKTDLIVVLSHNGFQEDSILATKLQEVDAIFGGHSHTRLYQPVKVNNILVCQAGARGQFLGHLNATVNPQSKSITDYRYNLIETVVGAVTPSPAVGRVVDSLESMIAGEMNKVIGKLKSPWICNSRGESNIGNWIADATRAYFQTDIAFQNSGGIRKGLAAGPITMRDIWEISPFDNTIVIVRVTGTQLLNILDWRIKNPRDLLQTSGLTRSYNTKNNTLIEATVNGNPIIPDKIYTIATNNYILGHIKRFFGLSEKDVLVEDTGVIGRDILLLAVKKQKIIDSKIEGRLIFTAK
ncbi:MAG: bifunctional metallophosphatase/5'-nucleotidase [Candidatus Marinimicrobia bacterium]|nr:bifunctional metallophosphatase/5'-nucleotidase [Candidatus Neomarinimicrobiota bacterium]